MSSIYDEVEREARADRRNEGVEPDPVDFEPEPVHPALRSVTARYHGLYEPGPNDPF